jgi:hypothetical protein
VPVKVVAIAVAPATREWVVTKLTMMSPKRDILVVVKNQFLSDRAIEREMEQLNTVLRDIESPLHFCTAHELVDRNRIIQKQEKILKESRRYYLRPFRFLINKN